MASPAGLLAREGCAGALPSWTIKDLTATFINQNATAKWTVINTSTGKSESLSCVLYAMSHCRIEGVPSDPNFHMYLQTGLDVAWVTINETVTCNDPAGPSYVIGSAKLPLICPEGVEDENLICTLDTAIIQAMLPDTSGL
ncbi:hypothetical protein GQ53DRAFT_740907 [Thozetella sp. PMI_491]|nr:hypothetical protein GQ53DRAFT_740907 [Thozetella sp. PMI_491]